MTVEVMAVMRFPEFMGHSGCTRNMTNRSPLEFLSLLVTDEILKGIVEQTNLLATASSFPLTAVKMVPSQCG